MTRHSQKQPARRVGSTRTSTGLRFTHLRLENWRNFSRVEIDLQRRVFLVGPNAAGKSNFLDVFRFLHDLVDVGGGLQSAVARKPRSTVSNLRSLAARNPSDIVIRVRVGDDVNPRRWDYELRIGEDKKGRPKVKRERVIGGEKEIFSRPTGPDVADPERLTQTHLEQVTANVEFRELSEFFGSVRYLHIVPQLVRDPPRNGERSGDAYGGDFLEKVGQFPENTRKARLRSILGALRLAVPQLQELEFSRDNQGMPHLRGKYMHWRPQGAWQTESQFSDGTLRLLGLLWAALDTGGPLLLEEPELSLHPEVVRALPQMFARTQLHSGRQIILSTHSPDLLRDNGIGQDEVLLLQPAKEGTVVRRAKDIEDVADLLMGGSNLAEIVMPLTRPKQVEQLTLFPD